MSDVSQGRLVEASDGKWYPPESPRTADPVDDTAAADPAGVVHRCSVRSCRSSKSTCSPARRSSPGRRAQLDHLEHRPLHLDQGWRWLEGSHERRQARGGRGTLFMTEFRAERTPGTVAFATKLPERSARSRCARSHLHGAPARLLGGTATWSWPLHSNSPLALALRRDRLHPPARFRQRHRVDRAVRRARRVHLAAGETLRVHLATWACSTKASTSRSCRSRASEHGVRRRQHLSRGAHGRHGVVAVPAAAQLAHALKPYLEGATEPDEQERGFLSMLES